MSIATLLVNDTTRSGVVLALFAPRRSLDGDFLHPFMWNDGYQRPSAQALPDALETTAVKTTVAAFEAIAQARPSRLEAVIEPCTNLIAVLGEVQRCLDLAPEEAFIPAITRQISEFRACALYNIATTRFHLALRDDNLTQRSAAVQRLGEVCALFEALEHAPFARDAGSAIPELSPDNLRVRALLAAATAQEIRVVYWAKDATTHVETLAAACHKAALLYRHVAVVAESSAGVVESQAVANFAHIKRLFYEGLCLFSMAMQPGTTKGEARRRRAKLSFETAIEWTLQRLPGGRKQVEEELQFMIHQSVSFDSMQRRGQLSLGMLWSARGRHSDGDCTLGAELQVALAPGDQDLLDATVAPIATGALSNTAAAGDSQSVPLLVMTTRTHDRNLVMTRSGHGKTVATQPFQFIHCLVTLESAAAVRFNRAKIAVVVVIDLNSIEVPEAAPLREMIFFALKSAALRPGDQIGVASHDRSKPGTEPAPRVQWVTLDESGGAYDQLHAIVAGLQPAGQFAGSRGTSVLPLINAATDELLAMPSSVIKHVIAMSDSCDRTQASTKADADAYVALRAKAGTVPVHTFVIGSVGQAYLLHDISKRSHGNAGLLLKDATEEIPSRVASLRSWIVGILTNACTLCVRNVRVTVSAAGESFVHGLALAPGAFWQTAPGSAPRREKEATLALPDFSVNHVSHVAITIAVPSDACNSDIIKLAEVALSYSTADGSNITSVKPLLNTSCPELVDRELFPWLRQLRVAAVRGDVRIRYPAEADPVLAKGSEALYAQDSLSTEIPEIVAGLLPPHLIPAAVLTAPEGLTIEVQPDTSLGIRELGLNTANLELLRGSIAVATADYGTVRVAVTANYSLVIAASSFVRVALNGDLATFRTVRGRATLELRGAAARGLEESSSTITLDAPKQTTAKVGEAPAAPWALAEDGLHGFAPLSAALAKRLVDLAVLDVERIRGVAVQCMRELADRICRRNRKGTLTQSTASRRCRKFIVMQRVNEAKRALSTSFAYAVGHPGIEEIKKLMDIASNLSSPLIEHRRTWAAMLLVADVGTSLLLRRNYGISTAFITPAHVEQIRLMLSARDRAAAEREAAAAAKLKEAADAERRRRQQLVAGLFALWDFGRRGAVSVADLQSVLFALDTRRKPLIARCISKWEVLEATLAAASGRRGVAADVPETAVPHSFTVEQLVSIVYYLGEELEAAEFNAFADSISRTILVTSTSIQATRQSRTLYTLFGRLDTNRRGYLRWAERCVAVLRYTFGDGHEAFARVEAFTKASIAALRHITPSDNSRPTSQMNHYNANDTTPLELDETPAITVDNIGDEKITPLIFLQGMRAFFEGVPEARANRELAMLCEHALRHAHFPQSIQYVMSRERKEAERRHLMEWDIPHVFDGVTDRDMRQIADPKWKAPDNIQAIAAPICLLCELVPLPSMQDAVSVLLPKTQNYWQALRNILKRDCRAFFNFLKDFPPLSISHWQAQVIGAALQEPGFEAPQLLKVAPVLSALCDWARLLLRLAYLEQDWEARPPLQEDIVSLIQAQKSNMTTLRTSVALVDAPPKDAVPVRDAAPRYSREFRPVYRQPATNEADLAGSSGYSPAIVSPRRPPSALSSAPQALRRPASASVYGSTVPQLPSPPHSSHTPSRPSTAKPLAIARPASSKLRSSHAAAAWHENGWEEPAGLNPDAY
jgi:hypothetical protein